MGEHAAFADQAGAMIDVQVVLRLGKQLADPGDLRFSERWVCR